ncbi:MAG TPA: UDP-N-acetylmuramoyl-tripeptide--D-alanyl-D-alanine ligase, partial [Alphaproteobacteria bacterium]|nr:UDP-N-acetylmuramoyl-tripeptide--D-alanyl-D-alanine ligase [Alphaproteobacteria bacterium]
MASADTVSWTGDYAAKVTGGWITHPWLANGVSIDSRTVASGELFVALVGDRFDGHDYINAALKAGAAAAMVSRVPDAVEMEAPLLVVPNTQTGLSALGAGGRARSRAQVVGVTGSVGKTGTKEMLRLTLSAFGSVHASVRSYNNAIGVPLTLANLPEESDYAVVEIGMNHSGEIAALSELSRPHVAVVTTVAAAHLGNFNNVDEIASAKAEIFVGIEPGGIAVLNRDNPFFRQLRSAAEISVEQVIGFGCATDATIRLIKYDASPGCNTLTVEIEGNPLVYQ